MAKEVIEFQTKMIGDKTEEIKKILEGLERTQETIQTIPMLLALILNDMVYEKYGFEEFKDENGEPWHGQAREVPKARKNYVYGNKAYDPLPAWLLPGNPTPAPARLFAAKATQRQRAKKNDGANVPAEVRGIQLFCNFWKFFDAMGRTLVVDSNFGSKTDQAVRGMQTKLGIKSDGIWGPQTERTVQGFLDYMVSR